MPPNTKIGHMKFIFVNKYLGKRTNYVYFGCVHRTILLPLFRYDYDDYCTDVTKFPRPRFASEFGFQSYPSFNSLANISSPVVRVCVCV